MIALAIACLMAAVWSLRDWTMLSALHLPDTDDVMRLQQIRDWLAGQAFEDLGQHRLGAEGLAMHWSRLPDLVPALIIAKLTPLIGAPQAELAAVIAWPTMLFAAALFLIASIARRLDPGAARTAVVVAAIAYPVTTLFLPGRIDHHGFQVVLLLVIIRALLAAAGRGSGAVIALAACASIVIGLETAPFIALAGLLVWIGWARGGNDGQMLSFGLTFGLALGFASIVFSGNGWNYPACDGFTRTAWLAAQGGAFAPVLLGFVGRATPSSRHRIAASGLVALALAALLSPIARVCVSPYGAVDPMLTRLWMGHVGEAQSMLSAPIDVAIGYTGVLVAGLVASLWCWNRRPGQAAWGLLAAFQLAALALACVQLRGAYVGAVLAAPALAVVIGMARRQGGGWLAAAWIGSAGILYPIAAQAIPVVAPGVGDNRDSASAISGDCAGPATMRRLNALPTGTIIAPVDLGAYAIAATQHRLIAAPYHRNNAGNAAMYRFFLGSPNAAERIARDNGVDYVVTCPGSFTELGAGVASDPHRLIGLLDAGRPPAWLQPLDPRPGAPMIFAVRPRLSQAPLAL